MNSEKETGIEDKLNQLQICDKKLSKELPTNNELATKCHTPLDSSTTAVVLVDGIWKKLTKADLQSFDLYNTFTREEWINKYFDSFLLPRTTSESNIAVDVDKSKGLDQINDKTNI